MSLPYKIAVLCYLYDEQDRLLLLHRVKAPNAGMYSPIGGKLDQTTGEGPHDCALREIYEEAGLDIPQTDREIMWPLVCEHRGGFFMVHIDCSVRPIRWTVQESFKLPVVPARHGG